MGYPRHVHQVWWQGAHALPAKFRGARGLWERALGAAWGYTLWSGDDIIALAKAVDPPSHALLTDPSVPIIQKCDLGRCVVLEHLGGFYADLDLEPRAGASDAALQGLLGGHADQIAVPADGVLMNNCWIASTRGASFWRHAIPRMIRRLRSNGFAGKALSEIRTLWTAGPLVYAYCAQHPDTADLIRVVHKHEWSPMMVHASAKDWVDMNKSKETFAVVYKALGDVADKASHAMDCTARGYASVRDYVLWPASFVAGAGSGLAGSVLLGSIVLLLLLYFDATAMARGARGRVYGHGFALLSFGAGVLIGFGTRVLVRGRQKRRQPAPTPTT